MEGHGSGQPVIEPLRIEVGMSAVASVRGWIVASGIAAILLRPIRFMFAPLLDRMQRRHLLFLTLAGVVAAGLGAAVLYS